MQLIKYFIIYSFLLFIEINLIHLISINNLTPDLILIFVIIISLQEKRNKSTVIGFVTGLMQDVFTTTFLGLSAMTKSIVGFWGTFFQQPQKKYNLANYALAVLPLVFVHEILYGFIFNLGSHVGFFRLLWHQIFPETIYTFLIAIIAYLIFKPWLWKSAKFVK